MLLNLSEGHVIFLFANSHAAIKAELAVKKVFNADVSRLIPLPPEVSAGCGMVLRVVPDKASSVYNILQTEEILVEGCYLLTIIQGKRDLKQLVLTDL